MTLAVGDRVRIDRDQTKFPPKGTWPKFRGKTGTVVDRNLGEIGVSFGKVKPRHDGRGVLRWEPEDVAWFRPNEVRLVGRTYPGKGPQCETADATAVPGVVVPESALVVV